MYNSTQEKTTMSLLYSIKIGFLEIGIWDVIDVLLVSLLFYQLYKLLKGTLAFNIFIGTLLVFLLSTIVSSLNMKLLGTIFNRFVEMGLIILVVVFQQEIRRFLFYIGRGSGIGTSNRFWQQLFNRKGRDEAKLETYREEIARAVQRMAATKTGSLIVFADASEKQFFASTGVSINGEISSKLIESIFDKHSPLHDGALVIADNKILAAGCVLPVSENPDIPNRVGMRHRAAVGITEKIDAEVLIISEERGKISHAKKGKLKMNITQKHLLDMLSAVVV